MARNGYNLLELDVDKLFEERKIEEIVAIEKMLDAEIQKKRVELRSMVGDRYKDVLAASDAIKSMKTISQGIVDNIQKITDTCQELIGETSKDKVKPPVTIDKEKDEERVLIVQIRLAIFMNEQIWIALDEGDNLTAAQFYLLAQHIHTSLSLVKTESLPLLKQIKANLVTLRDQISHRINEKLESVEITAEETSSNLNALLLLQNQTPEQLLNIFIDHRKIALNTVINKPHLSVRVQVGAMVRCLITTIRLLHDCFMCWRDYKRGLIWQQLEEIIAKSSPTTLSKVVLPATPLNAYIPDVIKRFKPKGKDVDEDWLKERIGLQDWLKSTKLSVKKGLDSSLKLVANVKGLHIIREEALKIELPPQWVTIASHANLPENFNVWYYFFQTLITDRARELISKKVSAIITDLQSDAKNILSQAESDLRPRAWLEEPNDVSRVENKHTGLSMKTLGYSPNIVQLCEKLDNKYLELLTDVSQYLYGKEFYPELRPVMPPPLTFTNFKTGRKFVDKDELEEHLKVQCSNNSTSLTVFLQDFVKAETNPELTVSKSLMCARFLQAITVLCPHFNLCCAVNAAADDWNKTCNYFTKSSLLFWETWIAKCVESTQEVATSQLGNVDTYTMISILPRWDTIEIQEQTEEKVFKSQIKVPLQPSLALYRTLNKLNDDISSVLPHTLPKQIHLQYIEKNTNTILQQYSNVSKEPLNQNQALQFLFDVKFLTTFCVPRENQLVLVSRDICDTLRSKIDPFDLDVFYSYLQSNVKRAVIQSQVILGCLLPSSAQLVNLGLTEKLKDQEREPSILALSVPSVTSWFPLLPVSVPTQKIATSVGAHKEAKSLTPKPAKTTPKKAQDPTAMMRSSAAALFGGLTTDWFS